MSSRAQSSGRELEVEEIQTRGLRVGECLASSSLKLLESGVESLRVYQPTEIIQTWKEKKRKNPPLFKKVSLKSKLMSG